MTETIPHLVNRFVHTDDPFDDVRQRYESWFPIIDWGPY